ncbi:anti-sigma factor domain-containing protein [Ascidiimonas sp. W6]|uniref:anti-sigma factor domain-containing protein n=1 Tax=Ascidiimonas meishanensis TaxID=3128903 RepID=UPI0030ED2EFC
MKQDIKIFLEDDLLERYLMGDTTSQESIQVEHFIDKHPEVKKQYDLLQNDLEQFAGSYATKLPDSFKEELLANIPRKSTGKSLYRIYFMAASVAAVIFAAVSITLWSQNNMLLEENNMVSSEILSLKEDVVATNMKLDGIKNQFIMLSNPETRKYVLKGNERARKLQTVAYINQVEKLSLINVQSLPELPEEQVYQMWADVNGEMVSLGVLQKDKEKFVPVPFNENAKSFNITIEPKGGNDHATVENTVANISFE